MTAHYGVFGLTGALFAGFLIAGLILGFFTYLLLGVIGTLWGVVPQVISSVLMFVVGVTVFTMSSGDGYLFGGVVIMIVTIIVWLVVPTCWYDDKH